MIRVLHFADLHLGVETYGRLDPTTGLNTRVIDMSRAFNRIVDAAIEESVDAVLFAGDAFRSKDPSVTYQREFARPVKRLIEARIPTVLLTGNHDVPNAFGRATALEIFRELPLHNIYVLDEPQTRQVQTKSGPLNIVALPWMSRSFFAAPEQTRNTPEEQIERLFQEAIEQWLSGALAGLDPEISAVALAHVRIVGAEAGAERTLLFGSDPGLSAAVFDRPELSYTALGHMHKHQSLGVQRPVVYSGSPERVDFGEEDEAKGYVVAEVQPRRPAHVRFCPLPARRFRTIDVKLVPSDLPPTEQVLNAIAQHDLEDTIVRVRVSGTTEQLRTLRAAEIASQARAATYFSGLQRLSTDDDRLRVAQGWSTNLTVEQVMAHYWQTKRVSADRIERLLAAARVLIQLEEQQ
ncbi:MAG: exonuclease SbcCD subunit D [Chloroflexi bacterium]|nr:exonuclease SbcCD subunit D [Chloroflexota bacterium]